MRSYVIHLSSAIEREPSIKRLLQDIPNLIVFPAVATPPEYDGPARCTLSHLAILKEFLLETKDNEVLILEDDCLFKDYKGAMSFLANAPEADVYYLGLCEYVDYEVQDKYIYATRAWGMHSYVINRRAARAMIYAYEELDPLLKLSIPPDWLLHHATQQIDLVCIGPCKPDQYTEQDPTLLSILSGILNKDRLPLR